MMGRLAPFLNIRRDPLGANVTIIWLPTKLFHNFFIFSLLFEQMLGYTFPIILLTSAK